MSNKRQDDKQLSSTVNYVIIQHLPSRYERPLLLIAPRKLFCCMMMKDYACADELCYGALQINLNTDKRFDASC